MVLTIKVSNLSNHYNLNENLEGAYSFITDCGNEYFLTFYDLSECLGLSELRLYEFGLELGKRVSKQNDFTKDKLRNTVVAALKRLFEKDPDCAVLIILDSADSRQKARYRMFLSERKESWFSSCGKDEYALTELSVGAADFDSRAFILITRANASALTIAKAAAEYVEISFGSSAEN